MKGKRGKGVGGGRSGGEGGEGETTERSYRTHQRASLPKTVGLRSEPPGGGHSVWLPSLGGRGPSHREAHGSPFLL